MQPLLNGCGHMPVHSGPERRCLERAVSAQVVENVSNAWRGCRLHGNCPLGDLSERFQALLPRLRRIRQRVKANSLRSNERNLP